jgi:hypothetical protein
LAVEVEPFFEPWLRVGLDSVNRAFRLANAAIDAFVRVDDEHVLALVETVHRTNFDAVRVLATNAALVDDVSQLRPSRRLLFRGRSALVATSGQCVRRVTCVAASVQTAHIHYRGLWSLSFDL